MSPHNALPIKVAISSSIVHGADKCFDHVERSLAGPRSLGLEHWSVRLSQGTRETTAAANSRAEHSDGQKRVEGQDSIRDFY